MAALLGAVAAVAATSGIGAGTASATTAPRATALVGLALPLDQWLATGRVSDAFGNSTLHTGDVLVRAWYFKRVCPAHGTCYGQFIRQLSGGGADEANILEAPGQAAASFAPTVVPCGTGASAGQGTEHDDYSWRQAPANGRLDDVHENATFSGCGSSKASALLIWSAVDVPLASPPRFATSGSHSATLAAFRQSLTSVCAEVNTELAPLTAPMAKDAAVLKAVGSGTSGAAADAAAGLAKLYPRLLPIAIKDYADVPQPPAPLRTAWLRYGQLERQELPEVASGLVALSKLYSALSRYERARSLVDLQMAFAEESLASADQGATSAEHQSATALAKQLALPALCTTPPALGAVGRYLVP